MSVVATGGLFPPGEDAPFCVHHAEQGKFKLFPSQMTGSACRGLDISQPMKKRLLTMTEIHSCPGFGPVGSPIAVRHIT